MTRIATVTAVEGRAQAFGTRFATFAGHVPARKQDAPVYKPTRPRDIAGRYGIIESHRDDAAMATHRANLKEAPPMPGIDEPMPGRAELTLLDDVTA